MPDPATRVSLYLALFEIRAPDDLDSAFRAISQQNIDGLIVPPDTLFLGIAYPSSVCFRRLG
jgi:hypothetical protein